MHLSNRCLRGDAVSEGTLSQRGRYLRGDAVSEERYFLPDNLMCN